MRTTARCGCRTQRGQVRGNRRRHNRGNRSRTEHRRHLAGLVIHTRTGTGTLRRQVTGRRHRQRTPDAGVRRTQNNHRANHQPQVAVRNHRRAQQSKTNNHQRKTNYRNPLRVVTVQTRTHHRRQRAREQRHRGGYQRSLGRVQALHLLQVQGQRERHTDSDHAHSRNSHIRYGEVTVTEQAQRNQRLTRVNSLPTDEQAQHQNAGNNQAPHAHRNTGAQERIGHGTPVVASALLNAEDQQEQADRRQHHAQPVEAVLLLLKHRHITPRQEQADQANRNVDEENPAPAEGIHQHATQNRANQRCDTRSRTPNAHGDTARIRREHQRNQRHGLRGHQRCTQALHHAGGNQRLNIRRQTTPQGGKRKNAHTNHVQVLLTEAVTHTAGNEQRHRIRQQVGACHPHTRRQGCIQILQHMRQGNGDNIAIHQDHKEANDQGPESGPGLVGCLRRVTDERRFLRA